MRLHCEITPGCSCRGLISSAANWIYTGDMTLSPVMCYLEDALFYFTVTKLTGLHVTQAV